MNNPYTAEQMLTIVSTTVADTLGCEPEEVNYNHSLVEDLDADSLDFVELNYALDKKLGFSLPKKNILQHAGEATGKPELFNDDDGLTQLGKQMLIGSFSHFDDSQLEVGMNAYDVMAAATVNNWASLCYELFNFLPETCADCGHDHSVLSASLQTQCAQCGAVQRPLNGDEAMQQLVQQLLQEAQLTESV